MKVDYWTLKKLMEIMEEQADIECVKFVNGEWICIRGTNDGKTVILEMEVKEDSENGA